MTDIRSTSQERANAPVPSILDADGNPVSIKDLPLVAYRLTCGHLGKDYGIRARDLVFCDICGTNKRVKKILAS